MTTSTTSPRPPITMPRFATYIEDRNPQWKYHKTLGQARSAITYNARGYPRGGTVWAFDPTINDWVIDIEYQQDFSCLYCGEEVPKMSYQRYRDRVRTSGRGRTTRFYHASCQESAP